MSRKLKNATTKDPNPVPAETQRPQGQLVQQKGEWGQAAAGECPRGSQRSVGPGVRR